jgi:anti-sigma regulatory factor (Ser/Thr protein kinase)
MVSPTSQAQCGFESDPASAAAGRSFVVDALESWGYGGSTDDAALVTSELVANAVAHGRAPIELGVRGSNSGVRIEVTDAGDGRPEIRETSPLEAGGLGLVLVAAVARRWGWIQRATGKTVWAELPG